MRRNRFIPLSALILLAVGPNAATQTKWQIYTAPDKKFSVEVPSKPNYQRRATIGRVGPLTPIEGVTVVDSYDLRVSEPNTSFTINVYSVIDQDPFQRFEKIRAASVPNPNFTKDEAVEINGLHGREYVYKKGKAASRFLIIFAEHLIYTVTFYTESDKGVERGAVNKVFESFKPTP